MTSGRHLRSDLDSSCPAELRKIFLSFQDRISMLCIHHTSSYIIGYISLNSMQPDPGLWPEFAFSLVLPKRC